MYCTSLVVSLSVQTHKHLKILAFTTTTPDPREERERERERESSTTSSELSAVHFLTSLLNLVVETEKKLSKTWLLIQSYS